MKIGVKNILFNGVHSSVSGNLLDGILKSRPDIQHVYAIASEARISPELFASKVETISYYDSIAGKYDLKNSEPLDQSIQDLLGNDWFVLLKMLDRQSPDEAYLFRQRLEILNSHIRFWNSFLDQKKIDLFLNLNYPHEVFDYVIYVLCKAKGIRVLFFTQTQISGYVQLISDIEKNDLGLSASLSTVSDLELPALMQRHWNEQTQVTAQPFYMADNFAKLSQEGAFARKFERMFRLVRGVIRNLVRYTRNPRDLVRSLYFRFFFGPYADQRLAEAYAAYAVDADLTKPYVYFPLHFQPECTTSPQAGYFVQQDLIIEMLLNTLPKEVSIYVKEHPMQKVHGRDEGFYHRIFADKRVVALKKTVSSKKLIEQSVAVATATGTAGWEALFYQKPVFLFGYIFFQYAPGVYRIRKKEDLLSAIDLVFHKKFQVYPQEDLKKFLILCDRSFIRGYVDPVYQRVSEITEGECVSNLIRALELKMEAGHE